MCGCVSGAYPPEYNIAQPVINCLIEFRTLPTRKEVEQSVIKHFLTYPRFSHRIRRLPGDRCVWEECESFDVNNHLLSARFTSYTELQQYIDRLMTDNLAMERPLWEIHLLENAIPGVKDSERTHFLVPRIHHSIGDGLSLVPVFMGALKDKDGKAVSLPRFRHPHGSLLKQLAYYGLLALRMPAALVKQGRILAGRGDTNSPFRDNHQPYVYTNVRHAVIFPSIPLQLVKDIKNACHATVNDVITALYTGTIRRYLEKYDPKGAVVSAQPGQTPLMRAELPFGLPSIPKDKNDRWGALHNLFVFLSVKFPIHLPSSAVRERIRAVKQEMDAIKGTPEVLLQRFIASVITGNLPLKNAAVTCFDVLWKSVSDTHTHTHRQTCIYRNWHSATRISLRVTIL